MSNDEIQFVDEDEYRKPEDFSKKAIILEQYRRCAVEGSKSMISSRDKFGEINQREIFVNTVEILEAMMIGDLEKHKELVEKNKMVDERIKNKNQSSKNSDNYMGEYALVKMYIEKYAIYTLLLQKMNWFEQRSIID